MGGLSPWHLLIVLVVVLLLFGSKKLPDTARGLGRSLRIFKSEMKEMRNDDDDDAPTDGQARELTQGQPNAAQYAQPQPHPQQAAQPQQQQQPQQHSDPSAPPAGNQGTPGQ